MHPSEHPLAQWLEQQIEEAEGVLIIQVIAQGAMYMGPVEQTPFPGVYQVHTPMQIRQDQEPMVRPVVFTCDKVIGLVPMPMPEENRIVTQ